MVRMAWLGWSGNKLIPAIYAKWVSCPFYWLLRRGTTTLTRWTVEGGARMLFPVADYKRLAVGTTTHGPAGSPKSAKGI